MDFVTSTAFKLTSSVSGEKTIILQNKHTLNAQQVTSGQRLVKCLLGSRAKKREPFLKRIWLALSLFLHSTEGKTLHCFSLGNKALVVRYSPYLQLVNKQSGDSLGQKRLKLTKCVWGKKLVVVTRCCLVFVLGREEVFISWAVSSPHSQEESEAGQVQGGVSGFYIDWSLLQREGRVGGEGEPSLDQ